MVINIQATSQLSVQLTNVILELATYILFVFNTLLLMSSPSKNAPIHGRLVISITQLLVYVLTNHSRKAKETTVCLTGNVDQTFATTMEPAMLPSKINLALSIKTVLKT